jgi:hypothetical protein
LGREVSSFCRNLRTALRAGVDIQNSLFGYGLGSLLCSLDKNVTLVLRAALYKPNGSYNVDRPSCVPYFAVDLQ